MELNIMELIVLAEAMEADIKAKEVGTVVLVALL
jgi:hypothetical protein